MDTGRFGTRACRGRAGPNAMARACAPTRHRSARAVQTLQTQRRWARSESAIGRSATGARCPTRHSTRAVSAPRGLAGDSRTLQDGRLRSCCVQLATDNRGRPSLSTHSRLSRRVRAVPTPPQSPHHVTRPVPSRPVSLPCRVLKRGSRRRRSSRGWQRDA